MLLIFYFTMIQWKNLVFCCVFICCAANLGSELVGFLD